MSKVKDYMTKKNHNNTIDTALKMNKSSYDYVDQLLVKYDDTFSDEEKENLNNLKHYLGESLNLFFNKLKV